MANYSRYKKADTQSSGLLVESRTVALLILLLFASSLSGCVSPSVFKDTLTKLERSQTETAEATAELQAFKLEAEVEIDQLKEEQLRLHEELTKARHTVGDTQADLESSEYFLENERKTRQQLERQLLDLQAHRRILDGKLVELRAHLEITLEKLVDSKENQGRTLAELEILSTEQDKLSRQLASAQRASLRARRELRAAQKEVNALRKGLDSAQVALSGSKRSLTDAHGRIAEVEGEKTNALVALTNARKQVKLLEAALAAEQNNWISLQHALGDGKEIATRPVSK